MVLNNGTLLVGTQSLAIGCVDEFMYLLWALACSTTRPPQAGGAAHAYAAQLVAQSMLQPEDGYAYRVHDVILHFLKPKLKADPRLPIATLRMVEHLGQLRVLHRYHDAEYPVGDLLSLSALWRSVETLSGKSQTAAVYIRNLNWTTHGIQWFEAGRVLEIMVSRLSPVRTERSTMVYTCLMVRNRRSHDKKLLTAWLSSNALPTHLVTRMLWPGIGRVPDDRTRDWIPRNASETRIVARFAMRNHTVSTASVLSSKCHECLCRKGCETLIHAAKSADVNTETLDARTNAHYVNTASVLMLTSARDEVHTPHLNLKPPARRGVCDHMNIWVHSQERCSPVHVRAASQGHLILEALNLQTSWNYRGVLLRTYRGDIGRPTPCSEAHCTFA